MKRREFITALAAAGVAGTMPEYAAANVLVPQAGQDSQGAAELLLTPTAGTTRGEMLYRMLGSTGEEVSALGLGGSHIAQAGVTEQMSIRLMRSAIDRGITFMDNSWDYNQGESEIRMGKALRDGYRQKVFLMTKIDGRTKDLATRQIETSLERLQTDHVDLLQHHEVLRFDDPDRIFAADGAMEAVIAAKQAGKVRHIGFTGHKDPRVHLYMLKVAQQHGFHFDTAQMPLNVMDAHFRSFAHLVVPEVMKQKIGLLSMKPLGGGSGIILKSNTVTAMECLHYALSLPTSVVITGIDKPEVLHQAFEVVKSFRPMNHEQIAALLAKTRTAAADGEYELFKTTSHFDTTAKHPDWLGGDTPEVQKLAPTSSS